MLPRAGRALFWRTFLVFMRFVFLVFSPWGQAGSGGEGGFEYVDMGGGAAESFGGGRGGGWGEDGDGGGEDEEEAFLRHEARFERLYEDARRVEAKKRAQVRLYIAASPCRILEHRHPTSHAALPSSTFFQEKWALPLGPRPHHTHPCRARARALLGPRMSKVEAAARAHSFAPRLVAEDGGRGGGGGGGGLAPHRKSLLERTDERVAKRQHELFYGPPPRPPAGQPTLVSRATREGAELLAKVGADPTTTPAPRV